MAGARPLAKGLRGNMHDSDIGAVHIRRAWGDIEVRDAEKDLRVFIAPEDVAKATEKDPAYCVFAQACRRAFHATKVLFLRSVAYVELPDEGGKRRVERFVMGSGMRELIESFDRGQGVIPEGGFILKAPTRSMQLDQLVAKERRRKAKLKERRKIQGTREEGDITQGKGKYRDKPLLIDLSVRNGTGAVHFTGPKKSE